MGTHEYSRVSPNISARADIGWVSIDGRGAEAYPPLVGS